MRRDRGGRDDKVECWMPGPGYTLRRRPIMESANQFVQEGRKELFEGCQAGPDIRTSVRVMLSAECYAAGNVIP